MKIAPGELVVALRRVKLVLPTDTIWYLDPVIKLPAFTVSVVP
jgi:hypothetical protein